MIWSVTRLRTFDATLRTPHERESVGERVRDDTEPLVSRPRIVVGVPLVSNILRDCRVVRLFTRKFPRTETLELNAVEPL